MKIKFIVILLCLFAIKNLFAQKDSTKLFYTKNFESTIFVETGTDFIQVNNSGGLQFNLSLNWLVKNKYVLGASYSQLASIEQFEYTSSVIDPLERLYGDIKHQSMGLRFGYVFMPSHKVISFSPEIIAGWGNAKLHPKGTGITQKLHFGKIQPSLNAIFNISKYLKIGLNVHYRIHVGKELNYNDVYIFDFSPSDLNGVGGGVSLRFGKF